MVKKFYLFFLFQILLIFLSPSSFAITLNDNGQMSATDVSRVVHVKSEADILKAIQDANSEHLPIAIMGKQHSQGGQSLAPKAIALDMLTFNKVLQINLKKRSYCSKRYYLGRFAALYQSI